jgi:hypothetical protein
MTHGEAPWKKLYSWQNCGSWMTPWMTQVPDPNVSSFLSRNWPQLVKLRLGWGSDMSSPSDFLKGVWDQASIWYLRACKTSLGPPRVWWLIDSQQHQLMDSEGGCCQTLETENLREITLLLLVVYLHYSWISVFQYSIHFPAESNMEPEKVGLEDDFLLDIWPCAYKCVCVYIYIYISVCVCVAWALICTVVPSEIYCLPFCI